MPTRDPSTFTAVTYLWVIGLSLWGGVVSYARKIKNKQTPRFSINEAIGEMATSGFIGVITFYLCEFADLDRLVTAAMVGISGHAGSRAIFQIENLLRDRYVAGVILERDQKKKDQKGD